MQAHDTPFAKQLMAIGLDSLLPQAAVAPHAGAWIETPDNKPNLGGTPVAPHAGAWIETLSTRFFIDFDTLSHPTRVRGLKLCAHCQQVLVFWSHPTRVRGLKRLMLRRLTIT